ncbi:MAG: acetylxylan esterase [Phycisphaerae bacterium]|nr:acetylxylan esterase [Phycisphaerae bacterium]
MPHFDLSLDALRTYRPEIERPADFETFWKQSAAEAQAHPIAATFALVAEPAFQNVRVFDVRFAGFAGQPICGWLLLPGVADATRHPCIVSFVGYGGGRGFPIAHLAPSAAGFAHFVMDTRGQGSGWSIGETPDEAGPADPQFPGFMTRGVASPQSYYYRRVFIDALRAVEAAASHAEIDASRIILSGASQGGGIAIAAAALSAIAPPTTASRSGASKVEVRGVCADVPFLCHFRRATTIIDTAPYNEIAKYLACHRANASEVYRTLSYFDGANFAPYVRCPALFSVGLMDQICPPSTVFAAYNRLPESIRREIRIYEFNSHEGGADMQTMERLRFAMSLV